MITAVMELEEQQTGIRKQHPLTNTSSLSPQTSSLVLSRPDLSILQSFPSILSMTLLNIPLLLTHLSFNLNSMASLALILLSLSPSPSLSLSLSLPDKETITSPKQFKNDRGEK